MEAGVFNQCHSPLALNDSLSVDFDIIATPFPEHDGLLERVVPCVLLPVLNIVCELQGVRLLLFEGPVGAVDSPVSHHRDGYVYH